MHIAMQHLKTIYFIIRHPLRKTRRIGTVAITRKWNRLRVVLVDYKGHTHASIDSPDDVIRVEKLIEKEGELVSLSQ